MERNFHRSGLTLMVAEPAVTSQIDEKPITNLAERQVGKPDLLVC